jgi:hypothetical protein
MTNDSVDETVTTQEAGTPVDPGTPVAPASPAAPATPVAPSIVRTERRQVSTTDPGRSEMTRRVVLLVFGLIQIVIGLRFILLLLDAREANSLVSAILNVSQVFVAPFDGILRTDALHANGSILDVTAVVAFVGWTILELIIMWAVGIFRRPQTA